MLLLPYCPSKCGQDGDLVVTDIEGSVALVVRVLGSNDYSDVIPEVYQREPSQQHILQCAARLLYLSTLITS